jgi:hypothetical protein
MIGGVLVVSQSGLPTGIDLTWVWMSLMIPRVQIIHLQIEEQSRQPVLVSIVLLVLVEIKIVLVGRRQGISIRLRRTRTLGRWSKDATRISSTTSYQTASIQRISTIEHRPGLVNVIDGIVRGTRRKGFLFKFDAETRFVLSVGKAVDAARRRASGRVVGGGRRRTRREVREQAIRG